ncbi:MAG TPA: hypothetical protein VH083_01255 [Myxococcales bacterium]|jgi:hypothetical protein|nr:hypothetical protein [Myxococcales bacterium]
MIPVLNQATGKVMQKPSNTSTLDLPADFDRAHPAAELDSHFHAHYVDALGKTISRSTLPRPLSWRIHGEECLIADRPSKSAESSSYTLARVIQPAA